MALAATVRQLRQTVEIAIREHRKMDAEGFSNLFRTLGEMTNSLRATEQDVQAEISRLES